MHDIQQNALSYMDLFIQNNTPESYETIDNQDLCTNLKIHF